MALLSREQVLNAEDRQVQSVDIPEWGGAVLVKSLSAGQVEYAQQKMAGKGMKNATAILIAMACVDEEGKRLFHESDLDALSEKSIAACQRILQVVLEQNALDKSEIEKISKNSGAGQSGSLPSD